MRRIESFADERLGTGCVHCGTAASETRDHVPSKVLLDEPYPPWLHVVDSCGPCNHAFSQDEEYLACLIESVVSGSTNPEEVGREKVARILRANAALAARLEAAKRNEGGATIFSVENDRVRRVMLKLASCHARYELAADPEDLPVVFEVVPVPLLSASQREAFETAPGTNAWPEIGCRMMQRLVEPDPDYEGGWVTVQRGRYRDIWR